MTYEWRGFANPCAITLIKTRLKDSFGLVAGKD
jgi:hypothetical protein